MKPNFPNPSGPAPHTPMVYVRDRTVWQHKVVTRDVPLSPSEEELNTLDKRGLGTDYRARSSRHKSYLGTVHRWLVSMDHQPGSDRSNLWWMFALAILSTGSGVR